MRCYLVQSSHMKRYASTNADATATRNMVAKPELLVFINSLCAESDVKAGEE